jgi:hypothetical protein
MSFEFSKLSNSDFLELSKTTKISNVRQKELKEPIEIDLCIRENKINPNKIKSNKSIGFIILRHVNN